MLAIELIDAETVCRVSLFQANRFTRFLEWEKSGVLSDILLSTFWARESWLLPVGSVYLRLAFTVSEDRLLSRAARPPC